MLKKINNFILSSIIVSILFILIGFGMIVFPEISLDVIAYTLATIFVVLGIYLFALDNKAAYLFDTMLIGVIMIIMGILLFIYPKSFSLLIPIVLGIWIITDSLFKIRISVSLREYEDVPWVLSLILAIISLVCGIMFIINPLASSTVITAVFGSLIIIYAISDIVDMIMFKRYISKIVKIFKDHTKVIEF